MSALGSTWLIPHSSLVRLVKLRVEWIASHKVQDYQQKSRMATAEGSLEVLLRVPTDRVRGNFRIWLSSVFWQNSDKLLFCGIFLRGQTWSIGTKRRRSSIVPVAEFHYFFWAALDLCCRFNSSKYGSPGMFSSVLRVSKQGKRTSKIICSEGPAFDLDLCCQDAATFEWALQRSCLHWRSDLGAPATKRPRASVIFLIIIRWNWPYWPMPRYSERDNRCLELEANAIPCSDFFGIFSKCSSSIYDFRSLTEV